MIRTFDKWLALAMALVVAVILVNAALAYHHTRQLHNDGYWVAQTNETLDAMDDLISTLKDAETGQRGFLIAGDERYLKPYNDAMTTIDGRIQSVESLTHDNDRQQARMPKLKELVLAKLDELKRTIDLRRESGLDAAQKEVLTHLGRNWMDAIRSLIAEMKADEQSLLRTRQQINDRTYRKTLMYVGIGAVVSLISVLAFITLMRRHLTVRAQAAAALHEQREWFSTTLGSIGDAVIATDTQRRVTFLNAVGESLTGWTQEAAVGAPLVNVFKIINEQSRKPVEDPATKVLREGTIVGLANHTVLVAKDGTERPIDDSAAPIRDAEGRIIGVVLVFRDVTERRRAEQALREADRRKDDFLAILSHELRNPLAPIRLAVGMLQKIGPPDPELRELRDIIERQTSQLARLLDDLLDVSRIASGKIVLRKERVSLGLAVTSAVESVRPLIDSQRHELSVKLASNPLYVEGDLARLAQVFVNLLNNAAKYTEKGGRIWLSVEREGSDAIVRVRDTGIGIPADQLTHIFEIFVQVDKSLERTRGGLGVGLSLVQRLIELHGGSIEAHSEGAGAGSEFIVRLPALVTPDVVTPAALPEADGSPDRIRYRILVADDNIDSARMLAKILGQRGHEVRVMYDGHSTIDATKSFLPELAILDIGMPEMNGYEVARRLRSEFGDRIVLVAITGWGQEEDKRLAREAGFDHHLTKPVDYDAIENLLAKVTSERPSAI
jgi:PAS domain S-box-containing protein